MVLRLRSSPKTSRFRKDGAEIIALFSVSSIRRSSSSSLRYGSFSRESFSLIVISHSSFPPDKSSEASPLPGKSVCARSSDSSAVFSQFLPETPPDKSTGRRSGCTEASGLRTSPEAFPAHSAPKPRSPAFHALPAAGPIPPIPAAAFCIPQISDNQCSGSLRSGTAISSPLPAEHPHGAGTPTGTYPVPGPALQNNPLSSCSRQKTPDSDIHPSTVTAFLLHSFRLTSSPLSLFRRICKS